MKRKKGNIKKTIQKKIYLDQVKNVNLGNKNQNTVIEFRHRHSGSGTGNGIYRKRPDQRRPSDLDRKKPEYRLDQHRPFFVSKHLPATPGPKRAIGENRFGHSPLQYHLRRHQRLVWR